MTSILRWALPFSFLAALGAACGSSGGGGSGGNGGTDPNGCPLDFDAFSVTTWPKGDCTTGQRCQGGNDCYDVSCGCDDGTWSCSMRDQACAFGDAGTDGGSGSGRWVSGYYVGYQQDLYPPEAIDWTALTHLMIGAVVPQADGSLDTSLFIDPAAGPALGKKLASLAHQHGRKAVIMLGGAGAHDGFVGAASAAHRPAFVAALAQLAADWSLDGFDLDWEPLEAADQADFLALAQDLRAAVPGTLLTVPVGWVNANDPQVDAFYGQIAPVFDQINLMSYGMAGPWDGWQSWHSAALTGETPTTPSSVDSSVKAYLAAGVPAGKLGLGIGFYGSCWTAPVNGPLQDLGGSGLVADDNVMTFDHIMTAYYADAAHHWDTAAQVPYLGFAAAHGPEGCTFVSYEDPQSIAAKGQYARDHALGGAIVWTINEGYRPAQPAGQQDPLMKALGSAFLQ